MSRGREDAKRRKMIQEAVKAVANQTRIKSLELEPAQADASQIFEPQQQPEKVRET
jgi:hypothetical protein